MFGGVPSAAGISSDGGEKPAEPTVAGSGPIRFQPGDWVVLRGKALGQIKELTAGNIVIDEADLEEGEESRFEVPIASAADVLRSMITAAEAQSMLDQLAKKRPTADKRPMAERSVAYRRIHKSGDIAEQIKTLGAIYGHPHPEQPEKQYSSLLEKVIFPELAHALKRSRKAIKAEVRAAALGQKPPASLALPDHAAQLAKVRKLPALAGYAPVGPFVIDTKLAVGEAHPEVTITAEAGIWFAYTLGDVDSDAFELVAFHQSALKSTAQLKEQATEIGEAVAEGAIMAIFDAAEAEDEEFADAVFEKRDGIVGQRCVVVSLGGDGGCPVFVATQNERAVYVRVVFSDESAEE